MCCFCKVELRMQAHRNVFSLLDYYYQPCWAFCGCYFQSLTAEITRLRFVACPFSKTKPCTESSVFPFFGRLLLCFDTIIQIKMPPNIKLKLDASQQTMSFGISLSGPARPSTSNSRPNNLNQDEATKEKSKSAELKFRKEWTVHFPWLCFDEQNQTRHCCLCEQSGRSNVFKKGCF